MIKWIGAGLILICSSALGFLFAHQYRERPVLLMRIKNVLGLLETEICYARKPLPQAIYDVSVRTEGIVRGFLQEVSGVLASGEEKRAGDAWKRGIAAWFSGSSLNAEDMTVLEEAASFIGCSAVEDQRRHLKILGQQIQGQIEDAERARLRNERMYRYLGILGGLMIILLLV